MRDDVHDTDTTPVWPEFQAGDPVFLWNRDEHAVVVRRIPDELVEPAKPGGHYVVSYTDDSGEQATVITHVQALPPRNDETIAAKVWAEAEKRRLRHLADIAEHVKYEIFDQCAWEAIYDMPDSLDDLADSVIEARGRAFSSCLALDAWLEENVPDKAAHSLPPYIRRDVIAQIAGGSQP